MRLIVLLVALFTLALTPFAFAISPPELTIVGGGPVPDPNPYRYQVSVGTYEADSGAYGHFCGGSLIAPGWVLTAAHCLVDDFGQVMDLGAVQVIVGMRDQNEFAQSLMYDAQLLVLHPGYDSVSGVNDIALIALSAPANDPGMLVAIALPENDAALTAPGTLAIVSGWGSMVAYMPGEEVEPQFPDLLHAVALPLVSNATCAAAGQPDLTASQICAGLPEGGIDSCQGDSGGPLVVSNGQGGYIQIGVVSFGAGCAAPDNYGVYTRVSAYSGWITSILNPAALEPAIFVPLMTR